MFPLNLSTLMGPHLNFKNVSSMVTYFMLNQTTILKTYSHHKGA